MGETKVQIWVQMRKFRQKIRIFFGISPHREEIEPDLKIPIQQEQFMEDLDSFRSKATSIENQITSKTSITEDIQLLRKYSALLKRFEKNLRRRRWQIRLLSWRLKSIAPPNSDKKIEKKNMHYFY